MHRAPYAIVLHWCQCSCYRHCLRQIDKALTKFTWLRNWRRMIVNQPILCPACAFRNQRGLIEERGISPSPRSWWRQGSAKLNFTPQLHSLEGLGEPSFFNRSSSFLILSIANWDTFPSNWASLALWPSTRNGSRPNRSFSVLISDTAKNFIFHQHSIWWKMTWNSAVTNILSRLRPDATQIPTICLNVGDDRIPFDNSGGKVLL